MGKLGYVLEAGVLFAAEAIGFIYVTSRSALGPTQLPIQ
jgi:hypothetical protein